MSWLLVALIPGLLMLATFGLERLESGLTGDTVSATDVDEFLQQAAANDVHNPHRRLDDADTVPGLPTRVYVHHRSNPQFQPTRHANSV